MHCQQSNSKEDWGWALTACPVYQPHWGTQFPGIWYNSSELTRKDLHTTILEIKYSSCVSGNRSGFLVVFEQRNELFILFHANLNSLLYRLHYITYNWSIWRTSGKEIVLVVEMWRTLIDKFKQCKDKTGMKKTLQHLPPTEFQGVGQFR